MGNRSRAWALACLLLLAVAVQPIDARRRSAWQRFVDAILPDSIQGYFGGTHPEPDEETLRVLSEADILELEKPVEGSVESGESHTLRMEFPPSGEDFPNILLSLSILNEDGDADIYCIPEYLYKIGGKLPSSRFSFWKSDHTEGADHIFISRNHEFYEQSKVGLQGNGKPARGVAFVCTVVGYSASGSDYLLEVDLDFTDRALVDSEQEAMEEIFQQCCMGSADACLPWKNTRSKDSTITMDFCHVPGNVCNPEGNLIRLDLSRISMSCEFPTSAISKLEKLEKLDLSKNQLKGDISEILESLHMKNPNLQYLNLNTNTLGGSLSKKMMGDVPVCGLTHDRSLTFLNLRNNTIEGELPGCLFDATSKLREISLGGNSLEGPLPEMSADSSLQLLHLSGVGLTGNIPKSIGELTSLVSLDLSGNSLEGSIPENLGSSPALVRVLLHSNQLGGTVPWSLATGENLKLVMLRDNMLEKFDEGWYTSGGLESSSLEILDVRRNAIEGEFPVSVASAPSLIVLALEENKLTGPLPDEPVMFPSTVVFLLAKNKFDGSIPTGLGDAGFFSEEVRTNSRFHPVLDLSNNMLTGEIPEFLYASRIPAFLWGRIRLGGNNFNLPCPVGVNFVHIKDLKCGNGTSPIDDVSVPIEAIEGREDDPVQEEVDAAAPQSEDPAVEPERQQPAPEPTSEDPDVEFTTADLASTRSRSVDLLARSKLASIPTAPDASARSAGGANEEENATSASAKDGGKSRRKSSAAKGPFMLIGVCFVLATVIAAIIIGAVIRRKKKEKSAVVSDVENMDLEMQTAANDEDGDEVHMLNGVKPSSSL